MSKKKELNREQLEKVSGGEEVESTQGLFKPKYVAASNEGGVIYNNDKEELKPTTDQYQPDLVNPINQGSIS